MAKRSHESVGCIGHRSHHFDSDPDPDLNQSVKSYPDTHQSEIGIQILIMEIHLNQSYPDPHHSEIGIRILIMEIRIRNCMQDGLTVLVCQLFLLLPCYKQALKMP